MGGDYISEDWETIKSDTTRTLVLVGKTGNGKSATGNTILNKKVFDSRKSISSITSSCEMQEAVMEDGRKLNVIDTPGLFDSEREKGFIHKEIMRCIDLAKEGIHALLMVFSVRNRYSEEERNALRALTSIFGEKIIDYVILVFTHGDDLEEDGINFENYISQSPEFLKILDSCGHRVVLFNNRTKDHAKRAQQINKLLSLVDLVVEKNGGQPFLDQYFADVSRGAASLDDKIKELKSPMGDGKPELRELWDDLNKRFADQREQFTEKLDTRVKEAEESLKQLLEEEKKARMKVEEEAKAAKLKSEEEIRRLRERLENAEKVAKGCSIL